MSDPVAVTNEAKRLTDRLEVHRTPEHGGWPTTAEIEPSVLARQRLRRRIADRGVPELEVAAWTTRRNAATATIDRHVTTADARTKLKRLYSAFEA